MRSLVLALLPFVATAVEPLTLETAVGGDVRCPGLGVKFTPMQRRVDGSFKGFVANAEAEAGGSLRWTFSPHGGDDQNVVMLKLDAGRWAGGKCTSDAQAVTIPRSHEKGRNIHLSVHESQRFTFTAAGETFSLDFGTTVKLHAMDEREWGFDTFVFRFYGKGDVIAATMASEHPFVAKKREPFVIQRGKRWIPVKIAREIKAGSALDFSWMVDGRDGSTSRPGGRDMALSLPCRRVVARGRQILPVFRAASTASISAAAAPFHHRRLARRSWRRWLGAATTPCVSTTTMTVLCRDRRTAPRSTRRRLGVWKRF